MPTERRGRSRRVHATFNRVSAPCTFGTGPGRGESTGLPIHSAPVGSAEEAVGGRHAVVVGMHRSGTSATAHTLVELGLSTPRAGDLIGANQYNERGHWESKRLSRFDENVLRQLGGTWSAPPTMSAGWEDAADARVKELRSQAAELAADILPRPPAVMKDPRLCLLLPFWRKVLPEDPVAVLVFRDPLEVALSLQRRNQFPLTLGLALWHRYVRQSLVSLSGLPVLVVEYGRVLEEPGRFVLELAEFLEDSGITPGRDRADQASQVPAGGLRHHGNAPAVAALEVEHRPLLSVLRASLGPHESWSTPELPEEPVWVEDVISLSWAGQAVTAAMHSAQDELKWLKRSRLFRAISAIWRMTGTGPVVSPVEASPDAADRSANMLDGAGAPGSNGKASSARVTGE
jgi:hypothetical protein